MESPQTNAPASVPKLPVMRPEERALALLAHLSTIIPLWALVGNGLLAFATQQTSRVVSFHARQGIHFQLLLLMVFVGKLVVDLFVGVAVHAGNDPLLAEKFKVATQGVVLAAFIPYGIVCLVGAVRAMQGKIFVYPLVGRSHYERLVRENRLEGEPVE